MDAEYYASCAFFIVCLLVLNFWLLNILVAVITNTFAEIMDETKHSAFAVSSALVDFLLTLRQSFSSFHPRKPLIDGFFF
jgi:hypothetical protein